MYTTIGLYCLYAHTSIIHFAYTYTMNIGAYTDTYTDTYTGIGTYTSIGISDTYMYTGIGAYTDTCTSNGDRRLKLQQMSLQLDLPVTAPPIIIYGRCGHTTESLMIQLE